MIRVPVLPHAKKILLLFGNTFYVPVPPPPPPPTTAFRIIQNGEFRKINDGSRRIVSL